MVVLPPSRHLEKGPRPRAQVLKLFMGHGADQLLATRSVALVSRSEALVTTSKALVTSSDALVQGGQG